MFVSVHVGGRRVEMQLTIAASVRNSIIPPDRALST